jgi:FkbM family methyltransferase
MSVKNLIKSIAPKFLLEFYYDFKNRRKTYYGHHELDKKLKKYLNYKNGFFVELGANDGIKQSNTYYFEKNFNWNGLLIEPIKNKFLKCIKFRSNNNFFYNNACVGFNFKNKKIKMIYSDLMSSINDETINNKVDAKKHALEGEKYLLKNEKIEEVWVNTKTLNEILDEINSPKIIDFLSLDVEGSELEVLNGVNFSIYNFKFILIESRNDDEIINYLNNKNYTFLEKISKRDLFFKYRNFNL